MSRVVSALVIEDWEPDLLMIEAALSEYPDCTFDLHWASTLKEGLRTLETRDPEVLLVDLYLPDSDGWSTFEALAPYTDKVPCIVLSGAEDEELAARCVRNGAQIYLIKGEADGTLLGRLVLHAVERHRIQTQMVEQRRQLELTEQRARHLEAVSKLQRRFMGVVTHEVRNPMAVIQLSLDVLLAELRGPLTKDQRGSLETISKNVRRLTRFAEGILTSLSLDEGNFPHDPKPGLLNETAESIVTLLSELANNRGQTLELDAAAPVPAHFDADVVSVLLSNLIGNALVHNDAGVHVQVRLHGQDNDAVIEVRDNGRGIPKEKRAAMFERFSQANASSRDAWGGAGLGLSISRDLAELARGSLEYQPLEPGTCFTVRLPSPNFL